MQVLSCMVCIGPVFGAKQVLYQATGARALMVVGGEVLATESYPYPFLLGNPYFSCLRGGAALCGMSYARVSLWHQSMDVNRMPSLLQKFSQSPGRQVESWQVQV